MTRAGGALTQVCDALPQDTRYEHFPPMTHTDGLDELGQRRAVEMDVLPNAGAALPDARLLHAGRHR